MISFPDDMKTVSGGKDAHAILSVFFSPEEVYDIVQACDEKGVSVFDFIRNRVMDGLY